MTVTKPLDVLVLGGGYAGVMAAARLARRAGERARVTLVNGRAHFVERVRSHQIACGQKLTVRSLGDLLGPRSVRLRVGTVREIDTVRRRVDMDGERIAYDGVVIALGSQADLGSVPGAAEHAHTLDASGQGRLQVALHSLEPGARVVVAGGGLTAIEVAAELAESFSGLSVVLVSQDRIAAQLSEKARSYCRAALLRLGVEVVEGCGVLEVQRRHVITSAGALDADLCVWAAGLRAHPLLQQAGLHVNERGQAWVDASLRALGTVTNTWVVGDAAQPRCDVGAPIHMTCKTALPMGAHAADNVARSILDAPQVPFGFGDPGYCVSLGRRDGLFQLARRNGRVLERIVTGRWVAFLKELACSYTWRSLWWESHFGLTYRWLRAPARATTAHPPAPEPRPEEI